jgi:hypothetical protein
MTRRVSSTKTLINVGGFLMLSCKEQLLLELKISILLALGMIALSRWSKAVSQRNTSLKY